jgi:hypothetical protein
MEDVAAEQPIEMQLHALRMNCVALMTAFVALGKSGAIDVELFKTQLVRAMDSTDDPTVQEVLLLIESAI